MDERFVALVERFAGRPGVEVPNESPRRFGSDALKVNGSIFAMFVSDHLVVKLPRHRVDALVASGIGSPLEASKGRPMKEWLRVTTAPEEAWLPLAQEAFEFVGGRSPHR